MAADTLSYQERADQSRAEEEFEASGQYFTLAAYKHLADCEYPEGQGLSSAIALGDAIYSIQSAAVDFYRAARQTRVENRCRQGILVLEDFRDSLSTHSAIDAVLTESIADLEVIAGIGNPSETYAEALSYYEDVGEPTRWQSEPIFQSTLYFVIELADAMNDPISKSTQLELMNSFNDRVSLKRDRLPDLLDSIDETK